MASEVPGAAASTTQHTSKRRLTSVVWRRDFDYNASDSTATCRKCGTTLCAGGKKGTSHLHRHIKTDFCRDRAEERLRQLAAPTTAVPSPGDQDTTLYVERSATRRRKEEEAFFLVDGINIPELFDDLDAKGLVDIDQDIRLTYAPVPQAANSSSRRFFEKTKERKRTESKKRCAQDEFSNDLSAQRGSSFRDKRMLANSAPYLRGPEDGETTTSEDCSNANSK